MVGIQKQGEFLFGLKFDPTQKRDKSCPAYTHKQTFMVKKNKCYHRVVVNRRFAYYLPVVQFHWWNKFCLLTFFELSEQNLSGQMQNIRTKFLNAAFRTAIQQAKTSHAQ